MINTYICECNDGYSGINCDEGMKYLTGCFVDCSQRGKEDRYTTHCKEAWNLFAALYYELFYSTECILKRLYDIQNHP